MSSPKTKILLAPILGISLALLLFGFSVTMFPPAQQEEPLLAMPSTSPTPMSTQEPFPSIASAPSNNSPIPSPIPSTSTIPFNTPSPRTLPSAAPAASAAGLPNLLPLLFGVAGIAVAVVTAKVLFSEKDFNK